jgi:hypothetical protein
MLLINQSSEKWSKKQGKIREKDGVELMLLISTQKKEKKEKLSKLANHSSKPKQRDTLF